MQTSNTVQTKNSAKANDCVNKQYAEGKHMAEVNDRVNEQYGGGKQYAEDKRWNEFLR